MKQEVILAQPVIDAPRFVLRLRCAPSDAGLLRLYAADRRVAQMTTSIPHPYPPGAPRPSSPMRRNRGARPMSGRMDASGAGGSELLA